MRRPRRSSAPLYLLAALLLGLVLLGVDRGGRLLPLKGAANAVMAPLQEFVGRGLSLPRGVLESLAEIGRLRQDNQSLSAQVTSLRAEVAQLSERARTSIQLAQMLQWKQANPNHRTLVARVIASDASGLSGTLTLDAGTSMGVRAGMPVVSGAGLVGRVLEAYPGSCRVILVTSPESRVNVRLEPKDLGSAPVLGTAQGTGQNSLILQATTPDPSRAATAGSLAITSGLGGSYPAGLYLGQVTAVAHHDYDLFETVLIQPSSDMATLDLVMVLTDFQAASSPPKG